MEQDEETEVGRAGWSPGPGSLCWRLWIYPKRKITLAVVQKWNRGSQNWKNQFGYEVIVVQARDDGGLDKGGGSGEEEDEFFMY